ncbi:PP0621 family protein [Paracidovorax anthurii]|uniref:Uncharacterized protein n=1 Tax=Paracidovorax anthurii TaxID=78229 RepID=A0A328ZUG5_9BURK|nr:PP0621 family protein [Paracidovorax anthurii]RAR85896.1 uncharacterized protein AX018_1003128 [Paracidovorax anthurii]WCM92552.1 hypothetical protein M5C99_19715 [Acidovorax sp. NCPPB 2350]
MKYLVLFLVLAIAFWAWRGQRGARMQQEGHARRRGIAPPQDMVPCAHCGVHLPRQGAVAHAGLHYCGPEHQRLGPR